MTEAVIEPTHDKQGRSVYTCEDCGYTYDADFVAPIGHELVEEIHAPTCTEEGYTYNLCSCGYHYSSDYVSPTLHTITLTEEVAPTCESEGYKIGDCSACGEHYTYDIVAPLGHELTAETSYASYGNEFGGTRFTCSRCDLDYIGDRYFYHALYQGAYVDNTEVLCRGIDVSKHNHNLDGDGNYLPLNWELIKSQGFEFAILRVGYMGTGNVFVPDPVFEMNYTAAKEAGLDVGAYIYSYAYSVEEARAEANAMLEMLDGKQFEYPIYFDIEYGHREEKDYPKDATCEYFFNQKGLTRENLTDICKAFISTMQSNGYFTALYTNSEWLTTHLLKDDLTVAFDIWYARYRSIDEVVNEGTWNTNWGAQMPMWQFSCTGTIEGIFDADEGADVLQAFDLNYCYKDYPALIKKYGLNGFPSPKDLSQLDKES